MLHCCWNICNLQVKHYPYLETKNLLTELVNGLVFLVLPIYFNALESKTVLGITGYQWESVLTRRHQEGRWMESAEVESWKSWSLSLLHPFISQIHAWRWVNVWRLKNSAGNIDSLAYTWHPASAGCLTAARSLRGLADIILDSVRADARRPASAGGLAEARGDSDWPPSLADFTLGSVWAGAQQMGAWRRLAWSWRT